ncbi:membrane metalloprotease [Flavobacteriaceae bacterium R38]|nr:membrane metalloprotease [Flavobacteriaceae bacterium R38]
MKKILFVVGLFSLILASCSSDDTTDETPSPVTPPANITANLQPVGTSARDFLTAENFNSIAIDIVHVEGFRPTNESINNLVSFIEERTFKPDGIRVQFTSIPSNGDNEFSIQEIAEIESERRTLYNDGDELTLFIFFADADSENSEGNSVVVGAAYRNTSMVIYESTLLRVLSNSNSGLTRTTVESGVLNHEMSHLFGLVDLGTPLQSDHLDTENGNHCNVPSCLMEFQIDFGAGMAMMAGNVIPQLDPQCIADLQANGGR